MTGPRSASSQEPRDAEPVLAHVPGDAADVASYDVLDTAQAGPKAIRSSALRGIGFVGGTLITLVSAPLLVRHLGVVRFGRYSVAIALTGVVAGVTDVGLASLAIREYAVLDEADRPAFMRNVLGTRILLTSGGVALATLFAALFGYGGELVAGTAIAGAGLVLAVASHTIGVPLEVDLRLGWMTFAGLLANALTVGLVVVLVLLGAGILPFLAAPIPSGVAMLVLLAALTRGRSSLRPTLHLAELRPLLRQTLPLAIATVMATLYARIVIIVLSLIAAAIVTGYFSTAARVLEVLLGVPLILVGTTFPVLARAARDDHERLRYVLQRVLEVALIGGVWMTMSLAMAAGFVISVIGGTAAAPAAAVLRVLSFALLPAFLSVTWQHGLLALRRHRALLVANSVGFAVIVVLAFVLVPSLHAVGAGYAVVIAEWSLASASGLQLLRAYPSLRPELRLVPRLALATALALTIYAVPGVPALVRVAVATTIYFGTLAALRAIPRELWQAVSEWIGRGSTSPERAPS